MAVTAPSTAARRSGLILAAACAVLTALVVPGALRATASAGSATKFVFAAPTGTGSACTRSNPCALDTAQDKERSLAPTMHSDVVVVLAGGSYHLAHALRLTTADSGRNGHRVIYRAATGAVPVLSGARAITGWTRTPGKTGLWQASIPAGFDTRQLYANGHRLPMASGKPTAVSFVQTKAGFLMTSTALDSWPNPSNLQLMFHGGNGPWTETSCPVAGIHGTSLTVAQPCWANLHLKALGVQELAWYDDPMGGFGGLAAWKSMTTFRNAYAYLSPGHWVIDRVAHKIFFQLHSDRDPNNLQVLAPARQTLFRIAGSRTHPVHDVTVSGLHFAYGGWTAPDNRNGFPQMQANWYLKGPQANNREGTCQFSTPPGRCPFASWTRTPANAVVTGAHRVSLLGNTFTHLGGVGLSVYNGSRDVLVKGNSFTDISGTGIELGQTNDPTLHYVHGHASWLNTHDTIADNYVHHVAIQYLGGIGIWLGYTRYATVTHNQIDHVPYTGISIGWGGWHATQSKDNDDNIQAHNLVTDNLIYRYMLDLGDGGAIYSNGGQAKGWASELKERGNVAYFGINTDFSLYTDAASKYIELDHNFVYDQPFDSFDSGGCRTVGHIKLHDNWFSQGGPAYPCAPYTDVQTAKNTTVCESPTPAQSPVRVVRRAGLEPAYRHLITGLRPTVELVGPNGLRSAGGDKVLISGSGFDRTTTVQFGKKPARAVRRLSANYLIATAPAGSGVVSVQVTTAHGTSATNKHNAVQYQAKPGQCVDYLGSNVTTKLFTG